VQTEGNLKTAKRLLEKLQVNRAAMRENLDKTKGLIMAQRVAFALAPKIDKDEADERLHEIIRHAQEEKLDFRTALLQDPTVSGLLSAKGLDVLLDPDGYIGLSREEVGAVISYVEGLRQSDATASSHRTQASENRR
jgi:adenylosuccinate lyase